MYKRSTAKEENEMDEYKEPPTLAEILILRLRQISQIRLERKTRIEKENEQLELLNTEFEILRMKLGIKAVEPQSEVIFPLDIDYGGID
jgi:hypothetical protein